MPFDGLTETPAIRRAMLIEALRAEMPAGFGWDFERVNKKTDCGTVGCAIGLACTLWPRDGRLPIGHETSLRAVGEVFGISASDVFRIFLAPANYGFGVEDYHRVTPGMVADALEKVTPSPISPHLYQDSTFCPR